MFITKKKHNQIVEDLLYKHSQELEKAQNLKSILESLHQNLVTLKGDYSVMMGVCGVGELNLPDNVLQYTEDILGGKVIKQEGTKCLVVDKQGNVKEGLTKQKADKGYSYKLVRE